VRVIEAIVDILLGLVVEGEECWDEEVKRKENEKRKTRVFYSYVGG